MYAYHAWPAELHNDDVQFGDVVFTFGPFVPFVDLPRLVNRTTWCTSLKCKVTPVQEDVQLEKHTLHSALLEDSNVVARDKTVISDVADNTMRKCTFADNKRYDVRQTRILMACYSQDPKPTYLRRINLAKEAAMTYVQVTTWFNNRRKREVALCAYAARRPPCTIKRVGPAGRSNRVRES